MRFTSRGYETAGLAADAVLINGGKVLLVQRANDPFQGAWALPGGFYEIGETLETTCLRELREETGATARIVGLLGVYSEPGRDPRGPIVSVAYLCTPEGVAECKAGDDAAAIQWADLDDPPPLAFDHDQVLADARAWMAAHQAPR